MTTQRTFKQRVRARMAKTGESYTAARRVLISQGDVPEQVAEAWLPPVSEEALSGATGRGWGSWLALVDEWGGTRHTHTEIARWLTRVQHVDGWWAQSITVGYERARGMRAPGQQPDGWAVSVTRTIAAPAPELVRWVTDPSARETWLPGAEMRQRKTSSPRTVRFDWEDGSTRVVFYLSEAGDARTRLTVGHEKLPDAETADEMKRWWRERLDGLKARAEVAAGQGVG